MMHNQKNTTSIFSCVSIVAILLFLLPNAPAAHAQSTDPTFGGVVPDVTQPLPTDNSIAPGTSPLQDVSSPTVPLGAPTGSNAAASNQTPAASSNTGGGGATGGLVICTGAADGTGRPICDFSYLLIEGRTIINWLFVIAIPIAIALFAYGGILYILGTPGNRTKANGVFTATGIGFGIMLIAWVSVYTIVSWLTTGTNGGSSNQTGITTFLGK